MRSTGANTDMRIVLLPVGLLLAGLLPGRADAAPTLNVFPAKVELSGQDDRQSLAVQVVDDQGLTTDVTASARLRLADPDLGPGRLQRLLPRLQTRSPLPDEERSARDRGRRRPGDT